jgi:membrane-associated phospholipid phosphatase
LFKGSSIPENASHAPYIIPTLGMMPSLIRKNIAFFIPYFFFFVIGGMVLGLWSKTDIHIYINRRHNHLADLFFSYWTNLGLAIMIIPITLILSFVRLRYVIISIIGFLIAVILTEFLKYLFYTPRPVTVFSQMHQTLYLIPNIKMHLWKSFPSGHTATGFCMFCLLALYSKNNFSKLFCFIVAFLIAYSRMYLSQHFLQDVYAGSIIGTGSALLTYRWIMNSRLFNVYAERLDKPLIAFHFKKGNNS